MIQLDLQPEIEAQLAADAHSSGLTIDRYVEQLVTTKAAEDDAAEARAGINRGLADVAAGRTRPAEEVFAELHKKTASRAETIPASNRLFL